MVLLAAWAAAVVVAPAANTPANAMAKIDETIGFAGRKARILLLLEIDRLKGPSARPK
ncbi:MAG TPA: hypothetical protein VIY51_07625 [Xanthobacteraceae bacterium]